ncbi:MAG: ABC transporter permease [Planctomycetes bacterium]|nr:ABC transporter permease [Planctomycetota bacterium]
MGPIAWLQIRQMLGQKKFLLVFLFLAIPLFIALPIRLVDGFRQWEGSVAAGIFLYLLYPQTICMLLALLYGTSVISSEIEDKTLTYLFTRPLPRWQLIVGKYVAIVACLTPPALVSLCACWLVLGLEGGYEMLLGQMLATAGAVAAYTAIFSMIGSYFHKRPLVIGAIYAAIEILLSFIPALVSSLTVSYFLRSLAVRLVDVDLPKEMLRLLGGASLPGAAATLALMIAAALVLSSLATMRKEYLFSEQA